MEQYFEGLFKGKRVLVTGDTGFKGSWLCIWLKELGADVYGFSLPPKTDRDNFVVSGLEKKMTHRDGDIRDFKAFGTFVREVNPEIAFHLAAQALVLYSYEHASETFSTNMMGTVNFFEAIRAMPSVRVAINVTSDKCYENRDWVWGYRENDPMGGKDPYSASKGCSELITQAYTHSFFSNVQHTQIASARAGNVIGGGDWAENRLVPDFFRAHLDGKELLIRNPDHTRPWQHVLEPLSGYLLLAAKLYREGNAFNGGWNFGPLDSNHYSVKTLMQTMISSFGKGKFITPDIENKVHEAHLLKLDISKAMKYLAWAPVLDFTETVSFTVDGYKAELANDNVYGNRVNQIGEYIRKANQKKISWASPATK